MPATTGHVPVTKSSVVKGRSLLSREGSKSISEPELAICFETRVLFNLWDLQKALVNTLGKPITNLSMGTVLWGARSEDFEELQSRIEKFKIIIIYILTRSSSKKMPVPRGSST
jgi:hypothetical protein